MASSAVRHVIYDVPTSSSLLVNFFLRTIVVQVHGVPGDHQETHIEGEVEVSLGFGLALYWRHCLQIGMQGLDVLIRHPSIRRVGHCRVNMSEPRGFSSSQHLREIFNGVIANPVFRRGRNIRSNNITNRCCNRLATGKGSSIGADVTGQTICCAGDILPLLDHRFVTVCSHAGSACDASNHDHDSRQ